MKKLLTIFALTATSFAADMTADQAEMQQIWAAWKAEHNKNYADGDEEHNRLHKFVDNFNRINAHNEAGNSTVTLGVNQFADLDAAEFKAKYLGYQSNNKGSSSSDSSGNDDKRFLASLPASVDWRAKGAVTSIKNQAHCGGCWSFSAAAALESFHFLQTGSLENFSMQQLLNCDKSSHGCDYGDFMNGFIYSAEYGIELLSSDPFAGKAEGCNYNKNLAFKVNTGHVRVTKRNVNALLTAVVQQPVSVAVQADQDTFRFYKSGVITGSCGAATDHAVLVVGYENVSGHQAFIVKNSWGAGWGQDGYLYISTSSTANGGDGVCGILTESGYPTN